MLIFPSSRAPSFTALTALRCAALLALLFLNTYFLSWWTDGDEPAVSSVVLCWRSNAVHNSDWCDGVSAAGSSFYEETHLEVCSLHRQLLLH